MRRQRSLIVVLVIAAFLVAISASQGQEGPPSYPGGGSALPPGEGPAPGSPTGPEEVDEDPEEGSENPPDGSPPPTLTETTTTTTTSAAPAPQPAPVETVATTTTTTSSVTPAVQPAPTETATTVVVLPPPRPECSNTTDGKKPQGWRNNTDGSCSDPPPHAGYCDATGKFYELEVGQHLSDPEWVAKRPWRDAQKDPATGAISCDFPKTQETPANQPVAQPAASPRPAAQPVKTLRQTKAIAPPPRSSPGPAASPPARSQATSGTRPIAPPPTGPPKGP